MNYKIHQFPVKKVQDSKIGWAVVIARYQHQWVFVKHKNRDTFESPGGTREANESIIECAKRELYEETGSVKFEIFPLEIYSIKHSNDTISYGQLFFANVSKISDLPDSEIEKIRLFDDLPNKLTYPFVHSVLFQRVVDYQNNNQ